MNHSLRRYTGAAFLIVVVTSAVSGTAADTARGSGSIAEVLASVADHPTLVRVATLVGLVNAVGILVLATLLFALLREHHRVLAGIAVLCWAGEAFFYALSQVATTALGHVAADYQAAGGASGPDSAHYESLGRSLVTDGYQLGATILMFFYCAGGLLFYYVFLSSRIVPRWLSVYGLLAVAVGLVGAAIELMGHRLGLAPYVAIGPFEILTGLYLLVRRAPTHADAPDPEQMTRSK